MDRLSTRVRRVIAHNPGPYTFHGTGTYIVGNGEVAVIDPGPAQPAHVAALLEALGDERVSHILVTHTHRDHSPAAASLKAATGAPTLGFGPHHRHEGWQQVEEGADFEFEPDLRLLDGERVAGGDWSLESVHTPGHTSNHLCFALTEEGALFCGDHVMGWSTSVIAPPDGDMGAYLASLRRLLQRAEQVYYPTHGAPIREPRRLVEAYLRHREDRERQVLDCLADGIGVVPEMVHRMYPGLDRRLLPAAGCSVLAHLLLLFDQGRVSCDGRPTLESEYRLHRR